MAAAANNPGIRTYNRQECITFRKTAEKFGGLSNMAPGYQLNVNGIRILTSEALYQACRFPHLPEVQRLIIAERSPMTAKMKSKPYRDNSRSDWDIVRTKVMRWSLRVKLIQNWDKFSKLLLETGELPIVEDSRKDDFWGAKPEDEETLTGANVLGRLLMQLREQVKSEEITSQTIVEPLPIPNFLLYGQKISLISVSGEYHLLNYTDSLDLNETASQSASEIALTDISTSELNFNEKNGLNCNLKEDSVEVIEPTSAALPSATEHLPSTPIEGEDNQYEDNQYDAFQIMLPYIVKSLVKTERKPKELVELFKIPKKLMSNWLEQAETLGQIRKVSKKPVRYTAETQLPIPLLSLSEN